MLEELIPAVGLTSGGFASGILLELTESGFVSVHPEYKKKKKSMRYRLIDEYSLFFLTWMKEFPPSSISENYWLRMHQSPRFLSWAGYAFESLCTRHLKQIIRALDLTVVALSSTQWSYFSKNERGAQIDLIIDRTDDCMNLCEIKFCNSEYVIDSEYSQRLNERRELFRRVSSTKKTLFNTFISTYGAKHNSHFLASVDQEVTLDSFFFNL